MQQARVGAGGADHAVEAGRAAVVDHVHLGRHQAVGDADAGAQHELALGDHARLAQAGGGGGAHPQERAGRTGGVAGGGDRREAQAALTSLDAGVRGHRRRIDRQHGRSAAPHPLALACAILYAVRLWSEKSSMNPGAAFCENDASALKVARLRS